MKSYVLVGNYGAGNFGDDALLRYFLLGYPKVRWHVVSARFNRGELPRLPGGIRSFVVPWWRTIFAIRKSDGLVFGGGTLFTDTESVYACFYWWLYACIAQLFRKPVFLAFQGVGPFRSNLGEWFAKRTFCYCSLVILRDRASFKRTKKWAVKGERILSFDPVITLLKNEKGSDGDELVLIPRRNSGKAFREQSNAAKLRGVYSAVRVLSFQPDDIREKIYCARLADSYGATVIPIASVDELITAVRTASLVITERFHGALCAMRLGKRTEIVSQKEGDKLSSLSVDKNNEWDALLAVGEKALKTALS